MATSETTAVVEDTVQQVLDWRELRLIDCGCDERTASTIARRLDVDLHEACDLLARGCTPRLVAEILL